ncbi:hypothetical protein ES703_66345 [subsurface metagenome]
MIKKLWEKILCWIGDHEWTCAAEEGIKPTPLQLKQGVAGFKDYGKMYCKRCGKLSNKQL